MREFGAVGEHELDCCTCVTEGKPSWGVLVLVMGRFAASPGGAASPLPAIRRRTGGAASSLPAICCHMGNEDVALLGFASVIGQRLTVFPAFLISPPLFHSMNPRSLREFRPSA